MASKCAEFMTHFTCIVYIQTPSQNTRGPWTRGPRYLHTELVGPSPPQPQASNGWRVGSYTPCALGGYVPTHFGGGGGCEACGENNN